MLQLRTDARVCNLSPLATRLSVNRVWAGLSQCQTRSTLGPESLVSCCVAKSLESLLGRAGCTQPISALKRWALQWWDIAMLGWAPSNGAALLRAVAPQDACGVVVLLWLVFLVFLLLAQLQRALRCAVSLARCRLLPKLWLVVLPCLSFRPPFLLPPSLLPPSLSRFYPCGLSLFSFTYI